MMQLSALSELSKALPAQETAAPTPPKQLLVQMLDLLQNFEGAPESGLLAFMSGHFHRKHGGVSGDKHLAVLVRSLLRFGREGSEIGFFARLVEQNAPKHVIGPLNEAIRGVKKKHQEIMSRTEETFKKVKVSFNEVISGLNKLFKRKVEDYDNVGGNNLKCRLRDYILKLHCGSNVLECSGLCYLEIVVLEAELVQKFSITGGRLLQGQDTFRGEELQIDEEPVPRQGSKDKKAMKKKEPTRIIPDGDSLNLSSNKKSRRTAGEQPFYGFADILGTEVERLSVSEIQSFKDRKELERKIMAEQRESGTSQPKSRDDSLDITISKVRRSAGDKEGGRGGVGDTTFEELYSATRNPKLDGEFLQLSKECTALEQRLQTAGEDRDTLPVFVPVILEAREEILDSIKERKELLLWMALTHTLPCFHASCCPPIAATLAPAAAAVCSPVLSSSTAAAGLSLLPCSLLKAGFEIENASAVSALPDLDSIL